MKISKNQLKEIIAQEIKGKVKTQKDKLRSLRK